MAADGGREAPSLTRQLFSNGRCFDFFQAVALLSATSPGSVPVGSTGDPAREPLSFASNPRLSSPAAPIESIEPGRAFAKPRLTVNILGIAGAVGPLPLPFSEIVLSRALAGDTAARDFLDIFNHRLLSLLYRIKRRHTVGLGVRAPEADDTFRYLSSIAGLGTPHLAGRLHAVSDGTVVAHAGSFAREVRSMAGLEAILTSHFGVPVEGRPLTGTFCSIDPRDATTIGPSGENHLLGRNAVLGRRYWDQEGSFEIVVGPLDRTDFLRFLPPDGDRLAPLLDLVRFYAGPALDFRVRLVLDPERARKRHPDTGPRSTLGERPRLGFTAWAGRAWAKREVLLRAADRPV